MNSAGKELLLDVLKGSIGTLCLFLTYVSLPIVGLFAGILAPLPAAYFTLKSGKQAGAAIVLISMAVFAVVAGVTSAILYLLQCSFVSLALPLFLAKGFGGARSLAYTVTLNLALILVMAAVYGVYHRVDLDKQVLKGVETSISQTVSLYEKAGVKGEELKTLQQGAKQAGVLIGMVYPALLIISLIAVATLNLVALLRFTGHFPNPPAIGDFKKFKNPEQLVWVVIVAGFAMLFDNAHVDRIALNILIVTLFMYCIQGLAVVVHLFTRFSLPIFVKIIFYFLLAVQPYLLVGVAAIGIFDIWGDFRTPKSKENL